MRARAFEVVSVAASKNVLTCPVSVSSVPTAVVNARHLRNKLIVWELVGVVCHHVGLNCSRIQHGHQLDSKCTHSGYS